MFGIENYNNHYYIIIPKLNKLKNLNLIDNFFYSSHIIALDFIYDVTKNNKEVLKKLYFFIFFTQ